MNDDGQASNLIEDGERIRQILDDAHRIAVLGIKPESRAHKPAHYVPRYLQQVGYDIVPVPVYYPEVREILGVPVVRNLREIEGPVDLVVVFRRPEHIPQHQDDLLELHPHAVWFQLGIRNDGVARELARAGILVVQDRCTMVEHRRR
jgi:predicted CoA-binding protein